MGCGSSLDAMYDDPMPVVVFGATGLVGGAVARALLRDRRFEVKAVTRTPTTDSARKLAEEGEMAKEGELAFTSSLSCEKTPITCQPLSLSLSLSLSVCECVCVCCL